jgi:hypothetical protein
MLTFQKTIVLPFFTASSVGITESITTHALKQFGGNLNSNFRRVDLIFEGQMFFLLAVVRENFDSYVLKNAGLEPTWYVYPYLFSFDNLFHQQETIAKKDGE